MARSGAGFSTAEAGYAAGLTVRQVGYWAATALLEPSVADPRGRGRYRRFDLLDVLTLRVLAAFRDRGVSLQGLRRVQRYLRNREQAELRDVHARLVFAPGALREVLLARNAEEVVSLLEAPGQRVAPFVVDVSALFREVEARVVDIAEARRTRAERDAKKREQRRAKSVKRERRAGGEAAA